VAAVDTVTEDLAIDGRTTVLTRPRGAGPWPGVVMIHEIFGIDDVLRRQAHRLASAGYVVLAPDLLGAGFRLACMVRVARALEAQQGKPFELVRQCQDWLRADGGCTGRLGVIGFCMGGGFALLLAARGFEVSSVNYGMIPHDLDHVLAGACPVVASYGGKDKSLAPKVPALQAALARRDIPHDVVVYPTAGHSFLNDAPNGPRFFRPLARIMGVGPDPVAAADAWQRIEAFFATYLDVTSEATDANG
jgi:carboxymethylenebutenolidase